MHLPYQCGFKRRNVMRSMRAYVKFNKQQLSDFLTENLPILNPYLPPKSENLRPHPSNSIENETPSSGKSPLATCKGVPPPRGGY